MKLKNILSPLFAVSMCVLINAHTYAANKVSWDGQAVASLSSLRGENAHLVDDAALQEIGSYVDAKLKNSVLPFEFMAKDDLLSNNTAEKSLDELQFALVPVVLDNSSFEEYFATGSQTFYKTVVCTRISVLLCAFGGELGNRVSYIYNIPLNGYAVLKTHTPAAPELLRKQFLANAQQLINRRLNIPANIEDFMNLEYGRTRTCRVANVDIAANATGMENIEKDELEQQIIPKIAADYTSAYAAAHPELVVLPENLPGEDDEKWEEAVAQHIHSSLTGGLLMDRNEGIIKEIKLAITSFSVEKGKAPKRSKDASFLDKYYAKVGLEDITNKKKSEYIREYTIARNLDSSVEIDYPLLFGAAAKDLARKND